MSPLRDDDGPGTPRPEDRRRRHLPTALSALALVVAVMAAALALTQGGPSPDAAPPVGAAPTEPETPSEPAVAEPGPSASQPAPPEPEKTADAAPEAPPTMSDAQLPPEVATAGLLDPTVLEPSDSVTVAEDGATLENLAVDGTITIQADDVTIRNVLVRANTKSFGINVTKGSAGTVIEHVEVEMGTGGTEGNGAIGGLGDHSGDAGTEPGDNVIVRDSKLLGTADGIKAMNNSLYERNYIAMRQGEGSAKHIDGIQSSGRSNWEARYNWVDQAYAKGHNGAIFAQAYTGKKDTEVSGIVIEKNWVNGGVYTIQVEDGKDGRSGFVSDVEISDNVFYRDYKYGAYRPRGGVTGDGGVWADTGDTVPTGRLDNK